MYVPAHFAAGDGLVRELLTRHGAADLVAQPVIRRRDQASAGSTVTSARFA